MVLEDILSIVLPNCPSTALAQMNFGWFLLFSSHFPFVVSFQKPAISTLDGKILDSYFLDAIFLLKCAFKQLQEWTLDG